MSDSKVNPKKGKPRTWAQPLSERFWSHVDQSGGPDACWPWLISFAQFGYGQFCIEKGKMERSHRVAYALTFGAIPEGMCVLHRCDNPACCNPAHLWQIGG